MQQHAWHTSPQYMCLKNKKTKHPHVPHVLGQSGSEWEKQVVNLKGGGLNQKGGRCMHSRKVFPEILIPKVSPETADAVC